MCLVEQSDLAACTSSASTKLIHGGLRYLEHFDFRLVREALTERERLRRRRSGFSPELVGRLARAYGTRMERVLGTADSIAELGETFGADLTAAEVEYLRAEELARTAEDILWRRSKLGLHISPEGTERLKHYLDKTGAERSLRARA